MRALQILFCSVFPSSSLSHLLFFSSLLFSSSFLSSMDVISLYYYDISFILLSILHSIPFFYHHKYVKFFFPCFVSSLYSHFLSYPTRPKMTKSFYFILFYSKITLLPLCYVALWHWDLKTQKDEKRSCLMCEICFYIYAAMISQQQIL